MFKRALWGSVIVGGAAALAVVLLAAFGFLGGEPRQTLPVIAIAPSESVATTPGPTGTTGAPIGSAPGSDITSPGLTTSTSSPGAAAGVQGGPTTSQAPGRETVAGPMRYQGNGGEGRTPSGGGPESSQGGGR